MILKINQSFREMTNVSEFIPELIGVGVDAVICALLYKGLSASSRLLKDLSSATQIDIEDNIKAAVEAQETSIHNRESSSVIIPYAAIRGTVHPLGKVISSTYSPDQVGVTTVSGVSGLGSQPNLF